MSTLFHKVKDISGTDITGKFGAASTDLGIPVVRPDGKLFVTFGDTFSGDKFGEGEWQSPIMMVGHLDAQGAIVWDHAGGPDPEKATKPWPYEQGGAEYSTILPADIITLGDRMYGLFMVNKTFGNVLYTEARVSDDGGETWEPLYRIEGTEDNSEAQQFTWDLSPDEGYVYAYTTKFGRDRGLRMRRIPVDQMDNKDAWELWGFQDSQWGWGDTSSQILPGRFGELCLRRLEDGTWVLVAFDEANYRVDAYVLSHPTANLYTADRHTIVHGSAWGVENHGWGRVAQLYGPYIIPGSKVGVKDGFNITLSQWETSRNSVYKSMQFRGTIPSLKGGTEGKANNVTVTERIVAAARRLFSRLN